MVAISYTKWSGIDEIRGGGGLGGVGVNHALIAGFIFYMVSEYFSQIITTIILGIE